MVGPARCNGERAAFINQPRAIDELGPGFVDRGRAGAWPEPNVVGVEGNPSTDNMSAVRVGQIDGQTASTEAGREGIVAISTSFWYRGSEPDPRDRPCDSRGPLPDACNRTEATRWPAGLRR